MKKRAIKRAQRIELPQKNTEAQKNDASPKSIEEAYGNLVAAVVALAVKDILRARRYETRQRLTGQKPPHNDWRGSYETAKTFFRSAWFVSMTGIDGKSILHRINTDSDFRERLQRKWEKAEEI